MAFIAVDGDNIGVLVGQSVLKDDVKTLKATSSKINAGQAEIVDFIKRYGGEEISGGGDEFVFQIPDAMVQKLEELRQQYKRIVGATLSVGVGGSLSEAGKALAYTKVTGKDKVTPYSDHVEQTLVGIHKDPQGEAQQKEDKAYLGVLGEPEAHAQEAKELEQSDLADDSLIPNKEPAEGQPEDKEGKLKGLLMDELNSPQDGKDDKEFSDEPAGEDKPMPYSEDGQDQQEEPKSHLDEAQVEALKQNIAHALSAMKENKQFLDTLQQQNPGLYYSIVLMIRAMIEMASMIGIKDGDKAPEAAQPDQGQAQQQQQQQPANPDGSPMVVNDMGKQ